jgi:ABC-type phosphate transport system permease subunit
MSATMTVSSPVTNSLTAGKLPKNTPLMVLAASWLVVGASFAVIFQLLTSQNSNTIAANIALNFPEAHGVGVNILLATGLMLFVITLIVNMIARVIINRRKAFSGAN